MHISGTYQINENLTAQVDLTVTDYGNESNAQNAFSNTELSCSPKPGLLPDDKAVMHHEGDGKAYCYTFYTDFVRSSPEKPDLTNHRANQHFKYLKQEVYGQYRISVSVSGDAWDLGNYLYYSGSYNGENIRKNITSGVMGVLEDGSVLVSSFLTVDDSTVLNLTVDENAYVAYLSHVEAVHGKALSFSTYIGNTITGRVISLLGGTAPPVSETYGDPPQIEILSPSNGQTIYFELGKPLTFEIRVKVTDEDLTYAGAHYESGSPKIVMIGGELQPRLGKGGGVGSVTVTLEPEYLGNVTGVVRAYAKDAGGNDVEKSITVYLREKTASTSSSAPSTSSTSTTPGVSSTTNTPTSSKSPIEGKQEAGDPSKFKNSLRGVRMEGMLSKEANARMKITIDKLKGIGSGEGLETVEVETPYGKDVKVYQKDEKVKTKKGSSLWFKLKYYGGKALDTVIDSASGALDKLVEKFMPSPVGLCKDYVKAYKDSQLFQADDATKKTMQDLHVSKEGAESYNEMSGIEDRQLALSPYKNLAPSTPLTKPFEFTFGALEKGFKHTLANNYNWEFEETAKTAMKYKKAGMKYEDIVALTIRDVDESIGFTRQVQTMNAQSKGKYQSQAERIKFYLKKLHEEGKI
ncbi:hypothetical protein A0127_04430 [Thermococcus peptonophilus]|uniref:Uncharacterized protein n=2 Tax=Thermococcus peptonophilus TaxID=53952 RepID=A0A142CUL6_9EURY|nr:hypothetical protein A0127_04430 [Thermococcus peptonophilus]